MKLPNLYYTVKLVRQQLVKIVLGYTGSSMVEKILRDRMEVGEEITLIKARQTKKGNMDKRISMFLYIRGLSGYCL
ncbi:hypothetical protein COC46_10885 [Bacillus sp. AFS041924]|nr:hypothetical protein COC46_10885 [Bacillus sp. AFS041924]